jgi:hypothetical protein
MRQTARASPQPHAPWRRMQGQREEVEVYSWGRGDLGQLGTRTELSSGTPTLVRRLHDKGVVHVAGSLYHAVALTGEEGVRGAGTVYGVSVICWCCSSTVVTFALLCQPQTLEARGLSVTPSCLLMLLGVRRGSWCILR